VADPGPYGEAFETGVPRGDPFTEVDAAW